MPNRISDPFRDYVFLIKKYCEENFLFFFFSKSFVGESQIIPLFLLILQFIFSNDIFLRFFLLLFAFCERRKKSAINPIIFLCSPVDRERGSSRNFWCLSNNSH